MQFTADLLCIAPSHVDEFWPYAYPLLKQATERCGNWSVGEIKDQINRGALLWIVWDGEAVRAACVTRLTLEPNGKVLEALACGGEDQDWRRLYEDIEDYGRNENCVISRIQGRIGWKRIFHDYNLAWVALEKRLDR